MTAKAPKSLTDLTQLPPELEAQLRNARDRRDRKIGDSYLGIVIGLFAFAVMSFTGYLALQPGASLWVLGGGATLGVLLLCFGALIADRETVWPVLRGMVGLAISVIKARKP
jgi:hypothetical protein